MQVQTRDEMQAEMAKLTPGQRREAREQIGQQALIGLYVTKVADCVSILCARNGSNDRWLWDYMFVGPRGGLKDRQTTVTPAGQRPIF